MTLSLRVGCVPERLALDSISDVELSLELVNAGTRTITIYPGAAKLAAIASFAGVGIAWSVALAAGDAQPVPLQELRTWYGPPGNPPAPSWAKSFAVTLRPGETHVTPLVACWLPNAALSPRHLDPQVLDPQGMDCISRTHDPSVPPLRDRIPLAQASVLAFGGNRSMFEDAMRTREDFLRGHVVAFVTRPGEYDIRAQYIQASWMGVGETVHSEIGRARARVG